MEDKTTHYEKYKETIKVYKLKNIENIKNYQKEYFKKHYTIIREKRIKDREDIIIQKYLKSLII